MKITPEQEDESNNYLLKSGALQVLDEIRNNWKAAGRYYGADSLDYWFWEYSTCKDENTKIVIKCVITELVTRMDTQTVNRAFDKMLER